MNNKKEFSENDIIGTTIDGQPLTRKELEKDLKKALKEIENNRLVCK